MKNWSTSVMSWIFLGFLSIVWGSSFILIKKALLGLSPTHVALLRVAVAFIAFTPFIASRLKFVKKHHWPYVILVGLLGNGFPAILYAIAQTQVLSATAGILNALTPIFTLLLGVVIFRSEIKGHQLLGTVVGFIGAGMLFLRDMDWASFNRYTMLIVLATACYGMSVNIVQHRLKELKPLVIASTSFVFVGVAALVLFLMMPLPDFHDPQVQSATFYVVLLSLASTFFATIIFYRLVQISDALFASSVSYIVPVIALLWGLIDGEMLNVRHLIALVLILSGVFMIRRRLF